MKDLKTLTDAAKIDILNLLAKDAPHVFEFRRSAEICGIAAALCGSDGTPDAQLFLSEAIRAAEDKAPHLYDALMGRAFDGEAMLRDKYEELRSHHTELRRKALDIEDAASEVRKEQMAVEQHKQALREHELFLERERERLQLQAGSKGIEVELPALPRLPAEEDEDTEEADSADDATAYNSAVEREKNY